MKLAEILNERQGQPVAYFMMGAPGSGKTTWIRANTPGFAKWIDIDEVNFREFGATPDRYLPTLYKASMRSYQIMQKYIEKGDSFILDGTGSNPKRLREQHDAAKAAGYKVFLAYIDVPLELALQQNEKRKEAGGRYVHPKGLKSTWEKIQDTWKTAKRWKWDKVFHVKRSRINESEFNEYLNYLISE
jgi:predicted kinase